jgi:molybdate transport system substrate-binding protein
VRKFLLTLLLLLGSALPCGSAQAQDLIVSAAASLTDAFLDIEPAFEIAHPDTDLILNFAGSGALYRQIEQGAPADVYASANPKWMQKAVEEGYADAEEVVLFARNALVLAVPWENSAEVSGLADLKKKAVRAVGIGAPRTVPAGQYSKSALEALGLFQALRPKFIFCEHVRQVLDYLSRGEVDAGFIYFTDAAKAGDKVRVIEELPLQTPVRYPMVVLKESRNRNAAQAFVAFVMGEKGRALLEARGFKAP